MNIYIYGGKNR
jgi:hypothetical protein